MKTISAEDFLAEMANRNIGLDTDYEPPPPTSAVSKSDSILAN